VDQPAACPARSKNSNSHARVPVRQSERYAPAARAMLYRHDAAAMATTLRPAAIIAHGCAPRLSNHCV
jgi:hypothetical protein